MRPTPPCSQRWSGVNPRQAFVADLFQIIGWGAGMYSLGVGSVFADLWGVIGAVFSGFVFMIAGNFTGAVLAGHFKSSIHRKLNQKQEKHGK